MSHIPNSAMPHAGGDPEHRQPDGLDNSGGDNETGSASTLGRIREAARDNPKTAIAAGVAITAGVAAAVAVPIARAARRKSEEGGSERKGESSGAKKDGGKSSRKKAD